MKQLVLSLMLLGLVSGCVDASYTLQRALVGVDCRAAHLQPNGQCAPTK